MRKGFKNILCVAMAATLVCGAASLAACGYQFTPLEQAPEAAASVDSNGGFVVKKGDYIYFINGVETYTSDNTYGTPEKGALMRIKEADVKAGKNNSEIVVPSLMVSGDTEAGIFIYGDRVYYATPENRRNASGAIDNATLDFKSAKLDGSDIQSYFYVSDNSTKFRYVEVDGTVYLLYAGSVTKANSSSAVSAILSYNTKTRTRTELVSGYGSYIFAKEKTDPWVYYTMSVTDKKDLEQGGGSPYSYGQIYRARADWTKVPEGYEYGEEGFWDTEALEKNNAGVIPYVNLGEIVLDGIDKASEKTPFNHFSDDVKPDTPVGYTYTLRSFENGGLYFVRSGGSDGNLYYLSAEKLGTDWNSVTGNKELEIVAQSTDVSSKATTSALYFTEEKAGETEHHYLYVADGELHHITAGDKGAIADDLVIAYDVSGASLKFIDRETSEDYKYVYFTKSNGSGVSVERAVYNGDPVDYQQLQYENTNLKLFKSVKVLDVQHATGWYDFEIVDNILYYADAATIGSVSYKYITSVDLGSKNNAELAAVNDRYEEIMGTKGLVQTLSSNGNSKLSALISYYFKTGERTAYDDNLQEASDHERSETYLFTKEEKDAFEKFIAGDGYTDSNGEELFSAEDYKDGENSYRTLSYFVTPIGKINAADSEAIALAWRNSIQRDVISETEEPASLSGGEIALIVIAIVVALAAAGLAVFFVLRKRKKTETEKPERMAVDTTDDRSVDVYSPAEEPAEEPATEAEAPAEEPEEAAPEEAEPAEEPAEEQEPAPEEEQAPAPEEPQE